MSRYLLRTLGFALGLTITAGTASAQGPIKIGELHSYKSQPAFLEPYKRGWEMAVEEVNAKGGVLGVAPVIVEQMASTIVELKREGLSILLSEQNIHFAELVCDRAYVLEKGQIRWHGEMNKLATDAEIQKSFLTV